MARPSFWEQYRSFGIVVDAGSSGSRLQIYSWLKHPVATARLKKLQEPLGQMPKVERGSLLADEWQIKAEPGTFTPFITKNIISSLKETCVSSPASFIFITRAGISDFASHPQDVGSYLKPLFDHALTVIPPSALSSTPVHVLATAGMRLLSESDRQALLSETCSFIKNNYPFYLPDCSQNIRVITGEEEGLFGWIAVNYLMDGFDVHHQEDEQDAGLLYPSNSHTPSTYGFLDMGGASTQIAFEPNGREQIAHADNLVRVRLRLLDGKDVYHRVFVTTWLGFGSLKARERYVDLTVSRHLAQDGDSHENGNHHLGSEHRVTVIDDPCLPPNLILTEGRHENFALAGNGDFSSCIANTKTLLNKNAECFDEPCLFDGVHVPPIDFDVNRFIGISDYWYSSEDLWKLGGIHDYSKFEQTAKEFCARPWNELSKDFKDADSGRLELQCFKAAWIANVLHDGIGIPRESLKKSSSSSSIHAPYFQSMKDVDDMSVSWTLGKMVLEVSQSIEPATSGGNGKWNGVEDVAFNNNNDIPMGFTDRARIAHTVGGFPLYTWMASAMVVMCALLLVLWIFCFSGRRRRLKRRRGRRLNEDNASISLMSHIGRKLRSFKAFSRFGAVLPTFLSTAKATTPLAATSSSTSTMSTSSATKSGAMNLPSMSPQPTSQSPITTSPPRRSLFQSLKHTNSTPILKSENPPPAYTPFSASVSATSPSCPSTPPLQPLRPRSRAGQLTASLPASLSVTPDDLTSQALFSSSIGVTPAGVGGNTTNNMNNNINSNINSEMTESMGTSTSIALLGVPTSTTEIPPISSPNASMSRTNSAINLSSFRKKTDDESSV